MSSCWRIDSISTWVIALSLFAWAPAVPNATLSGPGGRVNPETTTGLRSEARRVGTVEGLQITLNRVQCGRDGARKREQRGDDEGGDHGQDDAVLGHRLAVFGDGEACAEVSDEIRESHCVYSPAFPRRAARPGLR